MNDRRNDNISRQAALNTMSIELLKADEKATWYATRKHSDAWIRETATSRGEAQGLATGIDIISSLPSVDGVMEWIPVSEALPEEGLGVLMCDEEGTVDIGMREDGEWVFLAESISNYWTICDEPVAWMPLPEPYREESEE